MDNVYIMEHPLIQHKISILRNKNTGTNEFRRLTEEIAVLMGYEALRDLPLEDVEVEKTGCGAGAPRRAWNGKRDHYPGSVCKNRTYRTLPGSGNSRTP